LTPACRVFKW